MQNKLILDRRTCLKGIGAALGLPLFDCMGWAESGAKAVKPPVRLGFMYMPHGVIMDQFWPKSPESFLTAPPPALESLRPVLDRCLLVKGISGVPIAPFNGAPHALELSTWLTAKLPDAGHRNRIDIGISADQVAAKHLGGFTALPFQFADPGPPGRGQPPRRVEPSLRRVRPVRPGHAGRTARPADVGPRPR